MIRNKLKIESKAIPRALRWGEWVRSGKSHGKTRENFRLRSCGVIKLHNSRYALADKWNFHWIFFGFSSTHTCWHSTSSDQIVHVLLPLTFLIGNYTFSRFRFGFVLFLSHYLRDSAVADRSVISTKKQTNFVSVVFFPRLFLWFFFDFLLYASRWTWK